MNSEQSFYYDHDDWQYPSPSSTPRSNKHVSFPFGDLGDEQTSHAVLDSSWSCAQLPAHVEQQPTHSQPPASSHTKSKAYSKKDKATLKNKQKPPASSSGANHIQPSNQGMNQSQQQSALTNSFLEQFDGASLQEPFQGWPAMDRINEDMSHMQTPPPTRDTSTKRKPHQPSIKFSTPSTIKSRRQSAPANDWLKRSVDQAALDGSPIHFTPSQFSPSNIQAFSGDAPFTAPTCPQSNIFWGQDSHNETDVMSISTQADTSFVSPPAAGFFGSPDHWPSTKASSKAQGTKGAPLSNGNDFESSFFQASRSKHVRPATNVASDTAYEQLSMSGVDPSVLWSSQVADTRQLAIPEAPVDGSAQQVNPYQYHIDELKRQKEQQRLMKSTSRRLGSCAGGPSTSGDAAPSLRRSLTDSRSRRSMLHAPFSDPVEQESDLASSSIPRHSSPLKRLRTDSVVSGRERANSSPRKSVVLAVDDSGRARTVIQTIAGPTPRPSRNAHAVAIADDSDSDNMERHQATGVKVAMPTPTRQDAQEALRAMRRERQQRNSNAAHAIPRLSTRIAIDSSALDDISPNTITDDEVQHSTSRTQQDYYRTHCICNHNVPNEYMLQCESCRHWSHLGCLGIEPSSAPAIYLCTFCGNTPPAGRGGSIRSNKNRERDVSPTTGAGQGPYYR